MKKIHLLGFILLLFIACEDQMIFVEEYPNWVRISIPKGRQAFAIAGSIEDTLLVSTHTKAFYTADKGQTWIESKDFQGPVWGLMQRGDTIVALFGRAEKDGVSAAALGYLYTLNFGKSWNYEPDKYLNARTPIGEAASSFGVKYRIKENRTPTAPGSQVFVINPSTIEKWPHLNNDWGALDFPMKVRANNLYLDHKQRLYVAASSGSFDANNCHQSESENSPAWIFISKRPLPQ